MKNVIFIFLISILVASCTKENSDIFVPYSNNALNDTTWVDQPPTSASVNQFAEIFSNTAKQDSVEVSAETKIRFSEFLDITFPPSFCKTLSGEAVTGKVKVEVIHLRKKGDFIRFDRPTTSYGRLLESGGAFYIKVTKNGKELMMDPSKVITLYIREANPVSFMQVFYGVQNLTGTLPPGTNPAFTWAPDTLLSNRNVPVVTRQDSSGSYQAYAMVSKNFNWVNCDYFLDASLPKTKISAVLPANFTNSNTSVFAVFRDQKVIVRLNSELLSRSFVAPNIPIGKKIIIVSISKIGDDLFLGTKDPTVENNLRVTINPERKTKAQIDQYLDGL